MSSLPTQPSAAGGAPPAGGNTQEFLWWIVAATSGVTGQEFFDSLVSHLAQALQLTCVMVTECLDYPTTRVRTLANWDSGRLQANIEYPLEGAPCQETIQGREVCFYPQDVNQKFAQEIGTNLVSYCGIPIMDAGGRQVIGHFAFFDDKRMEDAVFANPIFHIFASRAAAEVQRKRAEEDGRRHLQLLAHASRVGTAGEMASAIAHEVNQPLTAISTYAQAALRTAQGTAGTPADVLISLQGIAEQAARAAAITRRLRGYLRNSETENQRVDLNELAQHAVAMLRTEALDRRVSLQLDLCATPLIAELDAVQIEQALLNLLRNAVEAAHPSPQALVTIRTRQDAHEAEIEIRDNGPGVPAEAATRIFDAFFTTKAQGMGIGLALSRSIAEAHGGSLALDPACRDGARFVLRVPLTD
ncbi:MAG TPA: ATP-binding protein [Burkholderiales bacterium]|nr:ATP-binding protein [Burkholderiales bacterium]